jgi:hypothetical protein
MLSNNDPSSKARQHRHAEKYLEAASIGLTGSGRRPVTTEPAMDGSDVLHAADLAATFLAPLASRDWSRNVPGLDVTVACIVVLRRKARSGTPSI